MRVNTNIPAVNAQRSLEATSLMLAKSVERLASGLRINRAADDAAGLSISEKLRAQVRGVAQAQRNAQDGVSMIQTAEGSLATVHSMLQRMRELAVQASNDTLSDGDRANVNLELQALKNEINGISARVKFNGKELLTGTLTANFQIGSDAADTISVAFTRVDVSAAGLSALNTALTDFDTTQSVANAQALITAADTSIASVNTTRATLGSVQNRLEYTIDNLGVIHENLMASQSRIRDADMAEEMVAFTKAQILQQAGTAILAQANQAPQAVLALLR